MLGNKSILCVIPARLGSKRFPGKVLAPFRGKPLIQWVFEAAKKVPFFDDVVLAVDSRELLEEVEKFGGKARLTAPTCRNGTERLIELYKKKEYTADIWVNWQGDEPFITAGMIQPLLQNLKEEVGTLKCKIQRVEEISSPHVVKVVCDARGRALYFSRSIIPHCKEVSEKKNIYKHIGLYVVSDQALQKLATLPACEIEQAESLEQLRFLYHGMKIQVEKIEQEIFGIDTKEELLALDRL